MGQAIWDAGHGHRRLGSKPERQISWVGSDALIVRVKLFASYKEKAGRSDIELSLCAGATVRDAVQETLRLYPAVTQDGSRLMIAVNQEYQAHDYALSDGDEVALIPPVSGGCSGTF